MRALLYAPLLLLRLHTGCGFQMDDQSRSLFREVVERAWHQKKRGDRPPLIIADDDAYPPQIPCPRGTDARPDPSSSSLRPAARPLHEMFPAASDLPPARNARHRRLLRRDNDPAEYWFDNRIHVLGNTGPMGAVHAAVAPMLTRVIDDVAYGGEDVRSLVAWGLRSRVGRDARVLDLCCGVGMSTDALAHAFSDADAVVGVDASPEMIGAARDRARMRDAAAGFARGARDALRRVSGRGGPRGPGAIPAAGGRDNVSFAVGNAERTTFPDGSFDLVTVMYGFHEIPHSARYRILREARRLLADGGMLAVVDISAEYEPSWSMLMGEPYVLEYQENIHGQMESIRGFANLWYEAIVPGHVSVWILTREGR